MNNIQTIAIGRYIDILNDLAFKTIFGCEANKDLLIALLNIILPDQGITDLQYLNKENSALAKDSKHSVFDVSCDTKDGRRIIVEVQREPQSFFEKRMIYYASLPILDQVRRGEDGNYDFDDIYMVCITKFSRKHTVKSEDGVTYRYALREESSGEIWSNALNIISLELGSFNKKEGELSGLKEQWYFCLKNMSVLTDKPKAFADAVFTRLFNLSEFENLPSEIKIEYYKNMTTETDIREQIKYGRQVGLERGLRRGMKKGRKEGKIEGKAEANLDAARKMKSLGATEDFIFQVTGLKPEEYQ